MYPPIPRDPNCDNDNCEPVHNAVTDEYEWWHVDDCDADETPVMTQEQWEAKVRAAVTEAPPNSFLATTFGPALLGEKPR